MAPRMPPSRNEVVKALRTAGLHLAEQAFRFGSPHFQFGVVAESGLYRLRRLEYDSKAGDAYAEQARAKGEPFMPEHAEMFMVPTGEVLLEAPTLDGLIEKLEAGPWPLD